jgi:hypothetical protein
MTYFLDFDRTLFDTDAFNRALVDMPACAPFCNELRVLTSTPLSSDDVSRKAVWKKVNETIESGALSFAPGELAQFVYKDTLEFLRAVGDDAIIMTYGDPLRQRTKIESALADILPSRVFYTGESFKGPFLEAQDAYADARSVFVDDWVRELEGVAALFPDFLLYEMRRNGGEGDGRWPVIHSLLDLPV